MAKRPRYLEDRIDLGGFDALHGAGRDAVLAGRGEGKAEGDVHLAMDEHSHSKLAVSLQSRRVSRDRVRLGCWQGTKEEGTNVNRKAMTRSEKLMLASGLGTAKEV